MPSTPSSSFRTHYEQLVSSGAIEADAAQAEAAEAFADLDMRLSAYKPVRKQGLLGRLFADKNGGPPRGLYIHGEVGRGKTMLMDLFFQQSRVEHKRRSHFHEFMAEVHERIYGFRQNIARGEMADGDVIALTAQSIFDQAWLLCFDEFHVTDIADAMILGRLFTQLFELGVVVVATSNLAPGELYKDGLNRGLFVPFIALLEKYCEVVRLDARIDFRLEKLTGVPTWYVPDDKKAAVALEAAWRRLSAGNGGAEQKLVVKGHTIRVPKAAMGVARFSFADLCGQPLAAADYLKIAHEFHTIILEHIPVMDFDRRNEAKRFIILIDTLYDHSVKLLASAQAQPDALYTGDQGFEMQEFKRTASRLIEMRSQSYLGLPHGPRTGPDVDTGKIVET
jgi:cell division protein ZapE